MSALYDLFLFFSGFSDFSSSFNERVNQCVCVFELNGRWRSFNYSLGEFFILRLYAGLLHDCTL